MGESLVLVSLFVLVLMPFGSCGFFDDTWNVITGKATSETISQSITVTGGNAPVIYDVMNETMTDVSSGPTEDSATQVIINFSVSDSEGVGNIDDSSAFIDFNFGGISRNVSCTKYESSGNYANYTCDVTMWWFDLPGTWSINASISDNNANSAENTTDSFYVGTAAGFESSPAGLGWGSIAPGAVDTEPSNHILMNNTGNMVRGVEVNATDLVGESNSAQALWATNFSVHTASGCGGTGMVADTYTDVSGASLPIGNYTLNDGTGQEDIYVCLEAANSILDAQVYSTTTRGAWTVKIVA
jgi:hypothetical protein